MEGRIVYRLYELDAYLDECEAADSRSNDTLNPLACGVELKSPRSVQSAGGGR